ncbi:PAX3- and PAX7-binding 1-like protein, putative [Babesia ovata]|uniref:PAX3-and PAX7-binding 1-like protein, putative n=1 Tax=Babesia ovata TaxID=189622 RepID=A0A2H6KIF8_9APIC|nr:PAX3- and PAX7-binding 1-like protein, putative [Babesia ovata]GBE62761.1 PAX3- and PAX7-binding 1-like protein, putative [Babesia ovata]
MFAKRKLLGKNPDKGKSGAKSAGPLEKDTANPTPGNADAAATAKAEKTDVESTKPDGTTDKSSFRRGLRDGSAAVKAKAAAAPLQRGRGGRKGGMSGLSFKEDVKSHGDVSIRKGVTNTTAAPESQVSSPPSVSSVGVKSGIGKPHSGTKPRRGKNVNRRNRRGGPSNARNEPYLDVDGEKFNLKEQDEDEYVGNFVPGTNTRGSFRSPPYDGDYGDISSDSSSSDDYYRSVEQSRGRPTVNIYEELAKPFTAADAGRFMSQRLSALRKGLYEYTDEVDEAKKVVESKKKAPELLDAALSGITANVELFDMLAEEARVLGGLCSAKLSEAQKGLQEMHSSNTDFSESFYCMYRWLLCDILRIGGVECDYSCGYLDEVDDDGTDLAKGVKQDFSNREQTLHSFLAQQKSLTETRVGAIVKNLENAPIDRYMSEDVTACFTLSPSWQSLQAMYPCSSPNHFKGTDVLGDVCDKYKKLSSALSVFMKFKESHKNEFVQMEVGEHLKAVYRLYATADVLTWDLFGDSRNTALEFTGSEWYQCVKKFCPEYLPRLVLDVVYPVCLKAIETWDLTDLSQSRSLARFFILTIENLPSDGRAASIDKLSSHFVKVLESRVGVLCPKVRRNTFKDGYIAGCWKFLIVQIARNIMQFSGIFTGKTLSNVLFDILFVDRLLPALDFQLACDAFAVAQFFCVVESLSPQLRVKNNVNAIIKSSAYAIAKRNWDNRPGFTVVWDQLNVNLRNEDYSGILDRIFT